MDAQIGRILDVARCDAERAIETIIVFCSDHGLAMGSHGLRGKQNMYEHTIGVPLIFAGPTIPRGKRVGGQAYLRDIFPTLCELSGLAVPDVDGRSQVAVIRGEQATMYDHVIGYFRDSQRMIRTDRWKLIEYPQVKRTQLFDLKSDPDELEDLSADPKFQQTLERLRTTLEEWFKT